MTATLENISNTCVDLECCLFHYLCSFLLMVLILEERWLSLTTAHSSRCVVLDSLLPSHLLAVSHCVCCSSQVFQFEGGRGTECSVTSNTPPSNLAAETYTSTSRCFEQGQVWTRTSGGSTFALGIWGSGCYEVLEWVIT